MRGIKNQHGNYLVDDFRIRIDSIDVSLYKGDLITQKVTKIEPVANIDFYDLEVGGNSMFAVGNGIVTHNSNAQPNITCRMFTESTEFIIWAVNSEPHKAKNWTFNYDVMKQMNDGKQMRNVFQIPVTPKSERKYGKHPAQKPEAILERLILAGTNEGDIIIDPFSGTGTTGVVAKRFNRNCVMIDNNEYYNDIAKKRLLDE
jgi:site-specific DNA-methyltransferase (adenine-specific)